MNATRDALTRLRAAMLDLIAAGRHTEANDVLAIIERLDPPVPVTGEAVSAARPAPGAIVPPVASGPATYNEWNPGICGNCRRKMVEHCTTHLLPCCPGSLMHGQDEGTWTPSANPSL